MKVVTEFGEGTYIKYVKEQETQQGIFGHYLVDVPAAGGIMKCYSVEFVK